MSDKDWDLRFAIRITELNKRLAQPGAVTGKALTSGTKMLGIEVTASPKSAQILEVMPGTPRIAGPKTTLAIQMTLSDIVVSGSGFEKMSTFLTGKHESSLHYDSATAIFEVTLQFVKVHEAGTTLVFDALPPNQPGAPALTAKIDDSHLSPQERTFVESMLEAWLDENFACLSPVFALFGEDGLSLGTLNYCYTQAANEGEDLLCAYAMRSGNEPAPKVEYLVPEFVGDGTAAFLLSESTLFIAALQPAMNAYAKSLDADAYNCAKGHVFKYDETTQTLSLDGVQLQSGTVTNEDIPSALMISQLDLRYGSFAGTDALQLTIAQSALLNTTHSYSQASSGQTRTETVPWCTIHRQQSDILDIKVGTGAQGNQSLDLNTRTGSSTNKTWSEPADGGTGNVIADRIIGFFEGAIDSLALFLGPPGVALFLVKLAFTTAGQEIGLEEIKDAKDRTKAVSPGSIIASIKFEWGGIGDFDYSSVKLAGGLKVVGT